VHRVLQTHQHTGARVPAAFTSSAPRGRAEHSVAECLWRSSGGHATGDRAMVKRLFDVTPDATWRDPGADDEGAAS